MSRIEDVYFNYIDSNCRCNNPNIIDNPYDELTELLKNSLSKNLQFKADNLMLDISSEGEKRGFIMGFKYATTLWQECN